MADRYDIWPFAHAHIGPNEKGRYVLASDYEAIEAENWKHHEIAAKQAERIAELEADLKAEWANLNVATEALRNLVFAVDHVDWDCTANAAMGRLDDARSAARRVLGSTT